MNNYRLQQLITQLPIIYYCSRYHNKIKFFVETKPYVIWSRKHCNASSLTNGCYEKLKLLFFLSFFKWWNYVKEVKNKNCFVATVCCSWDDIFLASAWFTMWTVTRSNQIVNLKRPRSNRILNGHWPFVEPTK